VIERVIRRAIRRTLGPDLDSVALGQGGDTPLVPVTGPHDPGTGSVLADEVIEGFRVLDQGIDEHQALRGADRPPGDLRLPAILAALLLGPFGVDSLELPEAFEDLLTQR
jgi:hypothetical protein